MRLRKQQPHWLQQYTAYIRDSTAAWICVRRGGSLLPTASTTHSFALDLTHVFLRASRSWKRIGPNLKVVLYIFLPILYLVFLVITRES